MLAEYPLQHVGHISVYQCLCLNGRYRQCRRLKKSHTAWWQRQQTEQSVRISPGIFMQEQSSWQSNSQTCICDLDCQLEWPAFYCNKQRCWQLICILVLFQCIGSINMQWQLQNCMVICCTVEQFRMTSSWNIPGRSHCHRQSQLQVMPQTAWRWSESCAYMPPTQDSLS